MNDYRYSDSPPPGWNQACDAGSALFAMPAWQRIIEQGLGASTIYAWNGSAGSTLSVFRAGPFRIAYLGFPAGEHVGPGFRVTDILDSVATADLSHRPQCLRIPASGFSGAPELDLPWAGTPETAITDLQSWSLDEVSKNLRRDIRRSERSGLLVTEADDPSQGDSLFRIYEDTIQRHRGSLRYSREYFRALVALSQQDDRLRVWLARDESAIAGFAVIALHANTAYYLHGGGAASYRTASPSDLLLSHSIASAKSAGCQCFNLMSSPPGQEGLVRYKEKWGGTTRQHRTYTLPMRATYRLFRYAELAYRLMG